MAELGLREIRKTVDGVDTSESIRPQPIQTVRAMDCVSDACHAREKGRGILGACAGVPFVTSLVKGKS